MTRHVQSMLPIYGLRIVPLVTPSLHRQVVVVHRRKTPLPRLARKLVAFALDAKIGE